MEELNLIQLKGKDVTSETLRSLAVFEEKGYLGSFQFLIIPEKIKRKKGRIVSKEPVQYTLDYVLLDSPEKKETNQQDAEIIKLLADQLENDRLITGHIVKGNGWRLNYSSK